MKDHGFLASAVRISGILTLVLMLPACVSIPRRPTHLYFTDHGTLKLQRCELGKWVPSDLVTSSREGFSLKVDSHEQAVFFTVQGDRKLFRCGMDGENRVLLYDGAKGDYYPMALDLDQRTRTVYIYCKETWVAKQHVIFKIPYGGGDPEFVMKLDNAAADIAIDSRQKRIYWFAATNVDRVWCVDDQIEAVANEFWCADLRDPDKRTLLIGTGMGIRAVRRAALDPTHGKVYWTQNDSGWANDKVRRSDLHGQNIEDIAWNKSLQNGEHVVSYPWGISLDLARKKVYWADINMDWLARTDLRGGEVEPLVRIQVQPGASTHPTGLDLGAPK